VSEARAELALAELVLDAARTTYLGLRDSRQPASLQRQQCVLDAALHRYHSVRHALRALEHAKAVRTSGTDRRLPMPSRAPQ
jgi:hypothetical protein